MPIWFAPHPHKRMENLSLGPGGSKTVRSLLDPSGYYGRKVPRRGHISLKKQNVKSARKSNVPWQRYSPDRILTAHGNADCHCRAFRSTCQIAHQYNLPLLAPQTPRRAGQAASLLNEKDILLDSVVMAIPPFTQMHGRISTQRPSRPKARPYRNDSDLATTMQSCKPYVDHPDFGSAWRQRGTMIFVTSSNQKVLQGKRYPR